MNAPVDVLLVELGPDELELTNPALKESHLANPLHYWMVVNERPGR